jgi:hypothetical protein
MKKLMTLFAFTMFTACAVESNDVSTTSQALSGWSCSQQCADGSWLFGTGNTPDEAYQNLSGCGPGGGEISCDPKPQILD